MKYKGILAIFLLGIVSSTFYVITEAYATTPPYHGHKWYWEETDVRYGGFSGLNISQSQAYTALDAARTEISSPSQYHMDKVTSGSNWITLASWSDLSRLGKEWPSHDWLGYRDGTDVEFNGNIDWSVGTDTTYANLRAVAIHEFGHSVDFTHTPSTGTIMYRSYYYYQWEDLSADDEDKLVDIYGA